MKRSNLLTGPLVLAILCWAVCLDAYGQFTQGPPGNPSAAGITMGSPAPVPVTPHLVTPPPLSAPPPIGAIGPLASSIPARPTGVDMINSPHLMLSILGLPALVDDPGQNGLARYLDLSVEQTAKIRGLTDNFYRETRNLRYELLRERIDMQKLFADPHADQAALLSKQKELGEGWRQLTDALAKTVIAARDILTAEQIEKLDRVGAD
jgi:hypothetical protein